MPLAGPVLCTLSPTWMKGSNISCSFLVSNTVASSTHRSREWPQVRSLRLCSYWVHCCAPARPPAIATHSKTSDTHAPAPDMDKPHTVFNQGILMDTEV